MKQPMKTDTVNTTSSSTVKQRRYWIAGALVISAALVMGTALLAGGNAKGALPDLLGKAQPPLPKGALQVQDIEADPKGYAGRIMVRGVVAAASPSDSQLFALIDSREARVCKDLHCAKWYLPVRVKDSNLKPWDEVNVRGIMTEDPVNKKIYLLADSVENLGSIKK